MSDHNELDFLRIWMFTYEFFVIWFSYTVTVSNLVFFGQPCMNKYLHSKKRPACNNVVENRPEQYFAAHIVPGC
jgi:hypothetical protein